MDQMLHKGMTCCVYADYRAPGIISQHEDNTDQTRSRINMPSQLWSADQLTFVSRWPFNGLKSHKMVCRPISFILCIT